MVTGNRLSELIKLAAKLDPRTPILYFGNDWFAENRTSSHHIARWLAKRYRVYYIECPGLRAPQGSGRDLKKVVQKLWKALRGPRKVPEGLKVKTLFQIPFHRYALVRRLNRQLISGSIRWLMWRERISRPISWFMIPHLASMVGNMGEKLAVYYCIDDYGSLSDVNEAIVREMDDETTRRADLVFIASGTLLEHKLGLNPNTIVSPHGVDVAHFGRAQDPALRSPSDTENLSGPIVGFFGLIERRIDLALLDYLAAARPDWTFLMIGRVAVPSQQLPSRPNLHFIGKRPYESLPAYGKQFDVAIIPYGQSKFNYHANPLKLREYLAMGKPVVTVSTPETDKYADVVEIANSRDEFLAKLDLTLSRPSLPADVRRRIDRVVGQTWDARLSEVLEHVEQRLEQKDGKAIFDRTRSKAPSQDQGVSV
jgi:glycosyltransferase involved in cell wall biosynthesis